MRRAALPRADQQQDGDSLPLCKYSFWLLSLARVSVWLFQGFQGDRRPSRWKKSKPNHTLPTLNRRRLFCRTDALKFTSHIFRFTPSQPQFQARIRQTDHLGNLGERFAPRAEPSAVITGLETRLQHCSPAGCSIRCREIQTQPRYWSPQTRLIAPHEFFVWVTSYTQCFQSRGRPRLPAKMLWPVCGIQLTLSVGEIEIIPLASC